MQNVVLTIHLILALLLTGVVLLQRSEGGGLGMGGGSGVMTGRQTANMMTRLTWIFGAGLFVTSIALTIIAARESANGSIVDQFGGNAPASQQAPTTELPGLGTYTPPPSTTGQPVTPPAPAAADAPATDAPAATESATQTPAPTADAATAPVTPPAADAPAQAPAPAAPATQSPAAETPAAPATN